ncbi:NAD(P)H-hydrate epimerase, partial [Pseudomonas sp. G5(2012)]|uniref:NAD(P)H-hydrate epimerase n=1 Tax=Pseudomonas sp. G5(2012) TaxID=1268068 RepID=UPI0005B3ABB7
MPHTKDDLPDALYSAAQVRGLDASLIAAGTSGFELMHRAARATWRALVRHWPAANELTVVAGHGNNAGDGYLVAVLAKRGGWTVRVLAAGDPRQLRGDAASAHAEAVSENVVIEAWSAQSDYRGIVLDALLGTGLAGGVGGPDARVIAAVHASGPPGGAGGIPPRPWSFSPLSPAPRKESVG